MKGDCRTCKHNNTDHDCSDCGDYIGHEWVDYEPVTTADRIRAMPDKELAEFISDKAGFSKNHWLKWLQSEVEE